MRNKTYRFKLKMISNYPETGVKFVFSVHTHAVNKERIGTTLYSGLMIHC